MLKFQQASEISSQPASTCHPDRAWCGERRPASKFDNRIEQIQLVIPYASSFVSHDAWPNKPLDMAWAVCVWRIWNGDVSPHRQLPAFQRRIRRRSHQCAALPIQHIMIVVMGRRSFNGLGFTLSFTVEMELTAQVETENPRTPRDWASWVSTRDWRYLRTARNYLW